MMMKCFGMVFLLLMCASVMAQKTTEDVRVSSYLYADMTKVDDASGGLVIKFSTPSKTRKVIAYGWSARKLRKSRVGTDEDARQNFKPRLAVMTEGGKVATFAKLPHDFYDVCVVDYGQMTFHEGLTLHHLAEADSQPDEKTAQKFTDEINESLGLRKDRIGGWEGFFDTKQIERVQFAEEQAGVLMQQLRKGTALAESGTKLEGVVHSIDVVWVQKTMGEGSNSWQVIQRQQLYRGEIPTENFFRHVQMPELTGIRIGAKVKTLKKVIELK